MIVSTTTATIGDHPPFWTVASTPSCATGCPTCGCTCGRAQQIMFVDSATEPRFAIADNRPEPPPRNRHERRRAAALARQRVLMLRATCPGEAASLDGHVRSAKIVLDRRKK